MDKDRQEVERRCRRWEGGAREGVEVVKGRVEKRDWLWGAM
jgi:hypothetical protein